MNDIEQVRIRNEVLKVGKQIAEKNLGRIPSHVNPNGASRWIYCAILAEFKSYAKQHGYSSILNLFDSVETTIEEIFWHGPFDK